MDFTCNFSKAHLSFKLRDLGINKDLERMSCVHVAGKIGFVMSVRQDSPLLPEHIEGIYYGGPFHGSIHDFYPAFSLVELGQLMDWIAENTDYEADDASFERWTTEHHMEGLNDWHTPSVLAELVIDAMNKGFLTAAQANETLSSKQDEPQRQSAK